MENIAATALAQGWRAHLQVHPAADMFPLMSEAGLRILGEDVQKNGQQVPVVLLQPKDGGDPVLFDGRNRLDAMELVGLHVLGERTELPPGAVEIEEREGFDPFAYVLSVNMHRRHLSAEQRDELIRRLKAERPELSIRAVAEITGTSAATVHRAINKSGEPSGVSDETPASGEPSLPIPASATNTAPEQTEPKPAAPPPPVIGRDGKIYKKRTPTAQAKKKPSAKSKVEEALLQLEQLTPATFCNPMEPSAQPVLSISAYMLDESSSAELIFWNTHEFSSWYRDYVPETPNQVIHLHARVPRSRLHNTLQDLVDLLRDEKANIADVPKERRVSLAHGYLTALGLTVDDLGPLEQV